MSIFVIVIIVFVLGFVIANIILLKQTAKFPMEKTKTANDEISHEPINKDLINKENVKANQALDHSTKDD
ncbi:hypothetical protein GCM10008107_07060 [Psychrosphaera saromensis]|jgi:hypothetical protein|uniref:DUF2897 domain-containing protein n=1 Tax=Psychrosphaera saromensis TaxID=716813 RepID=A0A2S7UWM7_9GAMM|nr:DUF2897 family protein [Psychrosphaera saromensis]PQJ54386.1 hypothetical protein BTO11_12440 [Psychrosphaera saromensis]GHB60404.1 hypothetical protein GCM10008107_07060 [Psychrosphaera saromensis]GLQ14596.1 hypothetical protein GCM10007917_20510 [Psychrosphaera saromensis]